MAHFAKIGINGKVLQVLTLNNSDMLNADGVEDESVGQQYLELHNNWPAQMWIQTSYNTSGNQHKTGGTPFRGNFAGPGSEWDADNNVFWPKKPFNSWVKDLSTVNWVAPTPKPALTSAEQAQNDAGTHLWSYGWNEEDETWDLADEFDNS